MNSESSTRTKRFVIVAGVDTEDASRHVTAVAASFAEFLPDGELHLVRVVADAVRGPSDPTAYPGAKSPTALIEEARLQLDELGALAREGFAGRVVCHIGAGDPAHQLLQFATNLDADMMFVGTHGRTGVRRLVLGSVAEQVVRRASCPVMVVREKHHRATTEHEIEPACGACLATQRSTNGATLWCARHSTPHPHARLHYQFPEPFEVGSSLIRA
jgi:nucleotide-binding universal stress UspA family protein